MARTNSKCVGSVHVRMDIATYSTCIKSYLSNQHKNMAASLLFHDCMCFQAQNVPLNDTCDLLHEICHVTWFMGYGNLI